MKGLRNPLVWLGLLLLSLCTLTVTDMVRILRAQAKIEAISKRYEDVLSSIRIDNKQTGYEFDFQHGKSLLLTVQGPRSDSEAIEIEEGLIRRLETARLLPSRIMYIPPPEDPNSSMIVRMIDLPRKN